MHEMDQMKKSRMKSNKKNFIKQEIQSRVHLIDLCMRVNFNFVFFDLASRLFYL